MNLADKPEAERPNRADIRRGKVIETARKLFIENGFHATGIAQIARESGIAVGQIYRDFSSKEDIVAALVESDCARFLQAETLDSAIRAGDREMVRSWLHGYMEPEDDAENSALFAEIVAESARNERIAAIFAAIHDRFHGHLLAALALLAPGEGLSASRSVVADAISTFSLGLLHHRLMRPELEIFPLVRLFQKFVDDQLASLVSDAPLIGSDTQ